MAGREVVYWHHALNDVSGAIALRGYTAVLAPEELEDWAEKLAAVSKEMRLEARRRKAEIKPRKGKK